MRGKKFVFSFFIFLNLTIITLVIKRQAAAGWLIDGYGNLVYETSAQVLGEGSDSSGDSSGSGSSGIESDSSGSGSSSSGSSTSGSSDSTKDEEKLGGDISELEDIPEATGKARIRLDDGKTEIIFAEGEKIKIRTKNGQTRTDVYSGGTKVRFEQKDGRLIIKAENEEGEDINLGEQEIFKIEERLDKNIVKIATGSGNSFILVRGDIAAKTNFPLSVDLSTNALIVNTPKGAKTVTILPDAAVGNMLAANVIDKLGPSAIATEAGAGNLKGVSGIITLGERNGVPIYEITGLSNQKLLGFIPVVITKTVVVSAETGETVSTSINLVNTFLDAFSF